MISGRLSHTTQATRHHARTHHREANTEVEQYEYKRKLKTNGTEFRAIACGRKKYQSLDFKIE